MNKQHIVKMLRQTRPGQYFDLNKNELENRRMSIHFSDGYDSEENRTWFFAVEGSPNKIVGVIIPYKLCAPNGYRMITNHGEFYFSLNGKKISKRAWADGDSKKD